MKVNMFNRHLSKRPKPINLNSEHLKTMGGSYNHSEVILDIQWEFIRNLKPHDSLGLLSSDDCVNVADCLYRCDNSCLISLLKEMYVFITLSPPLLAS